MKILIGCDHAGFELKNALMSFFKEKQLSVEDVGAYSAESVDYVDFGEKVAKAISNGQADKGILICGTGIGMSIVANKFDGIRASLCNDPYTAKMSRLHNDANILALAGRILTQENAVKIVDVWLSTSFEGGRHKRRIDKIKLIEKELKNP
jgi:ribose 5-phosphate isomerase B